MSNQTKPLTESDRTILKKEKLLGNTFLYIFGGLGVTLLIFVVYYQPLIYISALLVLLGILISRFANRKINRDLALGLKHVYVKEIGELLVNPKFSDTTRLVAPAYQRISNYYVGYGVKVGNLLYFIDKATYDQLQGQTQCEVHYTPNSATFLGVHPCEN